MLEGVLTVFFEETDGRRVSTKLKKWEVISCPAGILHGFHNEGNEDVYMQTFVGSGRPGPVGYVDATSTKKNRSGSRLTKPRLNDRRCSKYSARRR